MKQILKLNLYLKKDDYERGISDTLWRDKFIEWYTRELSLETKKNNMKQTAVDWFQDQIIKIVNGNCELSEIQIFEQAKAMEKEQIIESYCHGCLVITNNDIIFPRESSEQYYNETYKPE